MWYRGFMGGPAEWGVPNQWWGWLLPLAIVDLALRGFALWRSARNNENVWFIFLLVVNSLGILPAVYLLTHKDKPSKKK